MMRITINIEGKEYEVRRNLNRTHPCAGCCFFDGENHTCPKSMPCLEFVYESKYFHILKEIQ